MLFRRRYLWVLGAGLIVIVIGLLLALNQNSAVSQELADQNTTVPFTHRVHVQEVGMDCQFCHSEARRAPQAGLPSLSKCMICHNYFTVDDADGQQAVNQLISAVKNGQAPQWPDVYKQPDFVYFSHQPHIRANVSCLTCHGDVPNMDLVQQKVDMMMDFCLDCHTKQQANSENQDADTRRLTDCITCHK